MARLGTWLLGWGGGGTSETLTALSCWAILTQWGYGEDMLEEIESMSGLVEIWHKAGGQALVLQ